MDFRVSIDEIEYDISGGSVQESELPNLLNLFMELNQIRKNNKPLKFYLFSLPQYIFIDDNNDNIAIIAGEISNINSLINSDLIKFTNAYVKLQAGQIRQFRADLSFEIGDANITIPLFIYNNEMPLKQKTLKIRFALQFYFA